MTQVCFESYYENYIFQCSGHAGFAKSGADIVCSAVSILCYTLNEFLEKLYDEGRISAYKSDFREGYVIMEFEKISDEDTGVFDGIDAILAGFRLLAENFPDYVNLDI